MRKVRGIRGNKYILNKIGLTYLYIKQLYITQWTLTFNILYDSYLQKLSYQVVDYKFSKEMNMAILDFATSICKARKPLCEKCFLSNTCKFYKN